MELKSIEADFIFVKARASESILDLLNIFWAILPNIRGTEVGSKRPVPNSGSSRPKTRPDKVNGRWLIAGDDLLLVTNAENLRLVTYTKKPNDWELIIPNPSLLTNFNY